MHTQTYIAHLASEIIFKKKIPSYIHHRNPPFEKGLIKKFFTFSDFLDCYNCLHKNTPSYSTHKNRLFEGVVIKI